MTPISQHFLNIINKVIQVCTFFISIYLNLYENFEKCFTSLGVLFSFYVYIFVF